MSFTYQELRNERQWKATTGLAPADFFLLCDGFAAAYERMHGVGLKQAADKLKQELALPTYQDCLFFVLFQLKNGLTQDCLGPVFGMDGSSAGRNFKKYVVVLEQALKQKHLLPRRSFASVEEFKTYLRSQKEINLDVSEYPIERPGRSSSSATAVKKKHTRKSLFLTGSKRYIFYLSFLFCGRVHDFEILKRCFDVRYEWFEKLIVRVDPGFQGIALVYRFKQLFLPIKRKRVKKGCSNALSPEEKQFNKEQAGERVVVEHSIGGMKRYRILSNSIRIKNTEFLDTVIGVCAGLWNFLLIQHNPLINNLH